MELVCAGVVSGWPNKPPPEVDDVKPPNVGFACPNADVPLEPNKPVPLDVAFCCVPKSPVPPEVDVKPPKPNN